LNNRELIYSDEDQKCNIDGHTPAGKTILETCHEGDSCKLKAYGTWATEFYVKRVISVEKRQQTKVCRGLVTANWTEGVANFSPDNGTRLIRADNINESCLFSVTSPAGRKIMGVCEKIMGVCEMGFACEVKAQLKNEEADVYIIGQVLSVANIGKPKQR
jgi:hypothetical protein